MRLLSNIHLSHTRTPTWAATDYLTYRRECRNVAFAGHLNPCPVSLLYWVQFNWVQSKRERRRAADCVHASRNLVLPKESPTLSSC